MLTPNDLPQPEGSYLMEWDRRFYECAELRDKQAVPKLSIVTPSFNQGRFIERTIRCILMQNYPDLEYIIIDGGSNDETLRIIEKYQPWISYWVSEPDSGMYDAINKGFARSSGEIMAWSPTGDLYESGALRMVGEVFRQLHEVDWLTSLYKVKCDECGRETARYKVEGFNRRAFRKGLYIPNGGPCSRYAIQQQSTFWRRDLWESCGSMMDDSMRGAGDFELWGRFFKRAELYGLERPLGVFMSHEGQESVRQVARMRDERERAFKSIGGKRMGRLEGWIRKRVLRRKSFSALKRIPLLGFETKVLEWNETAKQASVKRSFFA